MERYVVGNIVRLAGGENGRGLLRRQKYRHRSQRCVDYLATYVGTVRNISRLSKWGDVQPEHEPSGLDKRVSSAHRLLYRGAFSRVG